MQFPLLASRLLRPVNRFIDEAAREWDVSKSAAYFHFWTPLAISLMVLASKVYQPVYHLLIMEDGIVEWGTFLFAFLAAGAAGLIAYRRWSDGYHAQATLFALFTMALVFLAGEEISWGQRVLGFSTPESLLEVNRKSEANLHNIGRFLSWTPFITLVAGALGTFAWIANRRIRIGQYVDDGGKLFVPPFFIGSSFLVVMLFSIAQFTILPLTGTTSTRFAEVSELCLAYGCFVFTWLIVPRMSTESGSLTVETAGVGNATATDPLPSGEQQGTSGS